MAIVEMKPDDPKITGFGPRLDQPATRQDVFDLFRLVLRRDYGENFDYVNDVVGRGITVREMISALLTSDEYKGLQERDVGRALQARTPLAADGPDYRVPTDLRVTKQPDHRVLLVGSCLLDVWPAHLPEHGYGVALDNLHFSNASALPDVGADYLQQYSYQICQIPMRALLADGEFTSIRYDDVSGFGALFREVKRRIALNLDCILKYNARHGMISFVLNFMVPQQNPVGRLQKRYYIGNISYFVEEMNRYLAELIAIRKQCYLIDLDQIQASFGRKYFSDELITNFNHSSALAPIGFHDDKKRLEPPGDTIAIYTPKIETIIRSVIAEAEASLRTIEQVDSVKMVIFDLDDTLWRGVAADRNAIDIGEMTEGWPLGVVEAAAYLRLRGVLIAIVSKNDEETALKIWESLYGSRFPIDMFVARQINWKPKADNVREILEAVNLLPSSVLFVDDNPVERASVKAAFPEIRVLDAPLAHWRRILLGAPELQRSVITAEGANRSEMVKAQIKRDDTRQSLDRSEFLRTLGVVVESYAVTQTTDARFDRCFELLNKTNQFNTTGKRWTLAGIEAFFSSGGRFLAFDVRDRFTPYGTTALMLFRGGAIEQFVMSCRIFGMDVEKACVALAAQAAVDTGHATITGIVEPTEKNILCRSVYADEGFKDAGGGRWTLRTPANPRIPSHIAVE